VSEQKPSKPQAPEGRVAQQRWQDFDVRGRVKERACAATPPSVDNSTTTTTGPGEVMSPTRADSTADPQAHDTPRWYLGARAAA